MLSSPPEACRSNPLVVGPGTDGQIIEVQAFFIENPVSALLVIKGKGTILGVDGQRVLTVSLVSENGVISKDRVTLRVQASHQRVVSTEITNVHVNGNTTTIEGVCKVNRTGGDTYAVTIHDVSSDVFSALILKNGSPVIVIDDLIDRGDFDVTVQ